MSNLHPLSASNTPAIRIKLTPKSIEKRREYQRKYKESHRGQTKIDTKKYYQKNKEEIKLKVKNWQKEHREQHNNNIKRYRQKHTEKNRAYAKKYYPEHREELLASHKKWREENLEKDREIKRRRRAKENSAPGFHTAKEIEFLRNISGGFCPGHNMLPHFVGKEKLTADHITPLIKGGSDSIENIQMMCGPCNSSKGVS